MCLFFFSSRRRHTRYWRDWSSDVCSSDLPAAGRDGERGLASRVQFRVERLALSHESVCELLEALAGPVLGVELVARGGHVYRVELDCDLLVGDGEVYLVAAEAYAQERRRRLASGRAHDRAAVLRQTRVDAAHGRDERRDEREAR